MPTAPRTLTVYSVEGHVCPYRDNDNNLHVGMHVGYDRDGSRSHDPQTVPDSPYYHGLIEHGALRVEEPKVEKPAAGPTAKQRNEKPATDKAGG